MLQPRREQILNVFCRRERKKSSSAVHRSVRVTWTQKGEWLKLSRSKLFTALIFEYLYISSWSGHFLFHKSFIGSVSGCSRKAGSSRCGFTCSWHIDTSHFRHVLTANVDDDAAAADATSSPSPSSWETEAEEDPSAAALTPEASAATEGQ